MNFLKAVNEAVKNGKKIAPLDQNGVVCAPYMMYDQSTFRWHYLDGVGLMQLPSPEVLTGDWTADDHK